MELTLERLKKMVEIFDMCEAPKKQILFLDREFKVDWMELSNNQAISATFGFSPGQYNPSRLSYAGYDFHIFTIA